ncbi:alpha-2,8-sialyltransferase 8E-like [Leptodactylus fuscus]|uniref:alpha-2,8-sialyltransferase 8E-like n=1 Tax=Leptodactylus fuscus TaxID=238119 RepID=UPI003F4E6D26
MRRKSCLPILIFFSLHGFYTNLQNRIGVYLWKQVNHKVLSPAHCEALRVIILQTPLNRVKGKTFMNYVSDLQRCPWKYDPAVHNLIKSQFTRCCNASHNMIATQQNIPFGKELKYEMSPRNLTIDKKIFQMLPKTSPFTTKPFDTCAVVGNGGILLNSLCGNEIDQMDYVFRLNLPPMSIADDIGTKSDFVSANPSILILRFQKLQETRRPFIELLKSYGSAMIVLPAFSYARNTDVSFRVLHSVQDFNLPNKVAFFHPQYLRNLSMHWNETGLNVKRLSSGLMLVSAAMELCKKVTLYGFWPFLEDPEGNPVPHHYYDNITPKPGFHSMPEEFFFYTKMHVKGALHLKVGQCSS